MHTLMVQTMYVTWPVSQQSGGHNRLPFLPFVDFLHFTATAQNMIAMKPTRAGRATAILATIIIETIIVIPS